MDVVSELTIQSLIGRTTRHRESTVASRDETTLPCEGHQVPMDRLHPEVGAPHHPGSTVPPAGLPTVVVVAAFTVDRRAHREVAFTADLGVAEGPLPVWEVACGAADPQ